MTVEGDEHVRSWIWNWDLKVANPLRWPLKNKGLTDDHRRKKINAMSIMNKPKSVGTLKLKSADPFDHPLVDPNYLSHPDDLERWVEGYAYPPNLEHPLCVPVENYVETVHGEKLKKLRPTRRGCSLSDLYAKRLFVVPHGCTHYTLTEDGRYVRVFMSRMR